MISPNALNWLAHIGFGAWFLPTLALLLEGSPEDFQRFGSFGVAVVICTIALSLNAITKEKEKRVEEQIERLEVRQRMLIEVLTKRRGSQFLDELLFGNETDLQNSALIESENKIVKAERKKWAMETVRFGVRNLEIEILFVATLQWGYGDLFHEWFQNALL